MDKDNIERIEKGEATDKDFPFTKIREDEIKATIGKEEKIRMFDNQMEFNKEVQIYVLNQMKKRELTSNFVVGTLYKLSWGIIHDDFTAQMEMIDKYEKGGR